MTQPPSETDATQPSLALAEVWELLDVLPAACPGHHLPRGHGRHLDGGGHHVGRGSCRGKHIEQLSLIHI